ncbi:hypothetical protein [Methylocella silvestris]|uniref:hypothetical protein n=1 Tax=Methylocella silvestris TaxID=199596 RepID=UPI0015E12394|nr:hypothetical protein [Methylocella silvestris]
MVQAKKSGSAAFVDILAGLNDRGPTQATPGRAAGPSRDSLKEPGDRGAGVASTIDVSWVKSAQARARAAYMAQQTAQAANETAARRQPPRAENCRETGPFSWDWGSSANPAHNNEPDAAAPHGDARAAASEAARGRVTGMASAANPVHALRRLLEQISFGWRRTKTPEFANAAEHAPAPSPRVAAPPKGEDEAIAEELGLSADLAIVDLRRIRRDFAKKNHPDRFAPAQRTGAARRMTIANMLIDERMKQRPPPK